MATIAGFDHTSLMEIRLARYDQAKSEMSTRFKPVSLFFKEEEVSNLAKSSGDSSSQMAYVNEQLKETKR